ncbi:TPA: prepilin-type N-terminal cleavage/methylation domain-containing protein [Vibrio vulnificus]|uniref:type IV pilus modification PilV family protein n=1 Tax=Vibrio vulnificus TaxID=672 RepID=UPI0028C69666|nr:prepilin-type N-terminal cleavage/methylation domain-containing protein [Vibrio vulnificus]
MIFKQKGFSLLEVLISFILIGIGALGLTKLQIYIEREADYASQSIQALRLAENQLELFRTRGASSASSGGNIIDFDSISASSSSSSLSPIYTTSWNVVSTTVSSSLKTIEIKTTWTDRLGDSHSIELKTMISKYSEFDM